MTGSNKSSFHYKIVLVFCIVKFKYRKDCLWTFIFLELFQVRAANSKRVKFIICSQPTAEFRFSECFLTMRSNNVLHQKIIHNVLCINYNHINPSNQKTICLQPFKFREQYSKKNIKFIISLFSVLIR